MAASIPHQYYSSDYNNSSSFWPDFCSFFPTREETSTDIFINSNYNTNNSSGVLFNYVEPPLMSCETSSPVSVASFPDQQLLLGPHSDSMVVPQMPEIETAIFDTWNMQYEDHRGLEGGEEECMVPRLWPAYNYDDHNKLKNWAFHGNPVISKVEQTEMVKVGRYSAEEKKDRILRYLKKKNHRNFNKTIKYVCRKTLADKRVRVRGRFAKNNDHSYEDELVIDTSRNIINSCYGPNILSYEDCVQMKYEEDCRLEAAMANLLHLPYC